MAKFCTRCGKRLEPGEICGCQNAGRGEGAPQMQPAGRMTESASGPAETAEDSAGQQTPPEGQWGQASGQQAGPQGQWNQTSGQQAGPQGQWGQASGQQAGPQGQWNQTSGQQAGPQGQWNQTSGQQAGPQGQWNPNYGGQVPPYGAGPQNGQGPGMSREAEWINEKKTMFVNSTRHMFSEIMPVLKRPVGRLREINASGNTAVGTEFIIGKAAIAFLIALIGLIWFRGELGSAGEYVKIPYFQILLVVVLATAGADFLEALLLKVFTGVFNGQTTQGAMINTVGVRAMYDTFILLIAVILLLIAPEVALMATGLCLPLTACIEYAGYSVSVEAGEDKKPYTYFVTKVCMTIVMALMLYLLVRSMIGGAMGSILRSIM